MMRTQIRPSVRRATARSAVAALYLLLASAAAVAQTAPPQPVAGFTGAQMVMSKDVWQKFVQYLNGTAATGFGIFMITVDGQRGVEKVCADYGCQINPIEQQLALDDCKASSSAAKRCVVFAEGRTIKMGYQVLP